MQKKMLMITFTILFTLILCGSVSAADYLTVTDLTLSHNSSVPGDQINCTAQIRRLDGTPVPAGLNVDFNIGSNTYTRTTNGTGHALYTYTVTSNADIDIEADFNTQWSGGNRYWGSDDEDELEVFGTSLTLNVNQTSTNVLSPVTFTSRLTSGGSGRNGETIHFFVNGVEAGSGVTSGSGSNSGTATFQYTPDTSGIKSIQALFYGRLYPDGFDWDYYRGSSSTNRTLDVLPVADVAITKEFVDVNGNPINEATYQGPIYTRITLTNNGLDPAYGVFVSDTFPSEMSLDWANSRFSYDNGATWIDYSLDHYSLIIGQSFTWDLIDGWTGNYPALPINPGDVFIAWIAAANNGHGNALIPNTAQINNQLLEQLDPNLTNNVATDSYTARAAAEISLTKMFADYDEFINNNFNIVPAVVNYLDNVIAIITVTNNGPDPTNVTITDNAFTGVNFGSNYYARFDSDAWGPDTGSINIPLTIPLDPGHSFSIAWLGSIIGTGTVNNTVAVTNMDVDSTTPWPSITATLNVPAAADIAVTKDVNTQNPDVGNTITYTFRVQNNGPDQATFVGVTDFMPLGLNVLGVSGTSSQNAAIDSYNWDPNTRTFTITCTWIDPNGWIEVLLDAIPEESISGQVYSNTATFNPQTANQYDYNSTNDADTANISVNLAADVAVTKEFRTDYLVPGSATTTANYHTPIWVMVHVINNGPDAAEGLQVTDILPAGLTYQNVYHVSHDNGATWTALDTFTAGVWDIGTMPDGADYWLALLAQVDGHNETIVNVANKTQTTWDQNSTNNEGNATLNIPAAADVFVNTSISKTNPNVGENVVVRVKVGNNGPDGAQNVVATYKIPAGMQFVGLNWEAGYPAPTYDPATGIVTWNLGNLTVIDPWMDITLKVLSAGAISSDASVTSDTYDPVPENNVMAVAVNAVTVKAATVGMQDTGVPIAGLVLALLAVFGGLVMPRRK